MGWIKRNLFFAIGVAVAAALLVLAVLYTIAAAGENKKNLDKLNELYSTLGGIKPGSDKQDNIEAARKQADELRQWVKKAKDYFKPVAPIPATGTGLTDDAFAGGLHRTITQLQHDADAAHVNLPPQYNFSFQAQSDKVRFAPPGSAEKLAVQLGEVKVIADILFAAHINGLEAIQRLKVSDDDTAGGGGDYIDDQPVTTELATLTPYQVTFRGFTDQIAAVLTGFGSSPHGFIIKTINVQPSEATPVGDPMAAPAAPTGRSPQTVLDERMLRVTMTVEVLKLSAGR